MFRLIYCFSLLILLTHQATAETETCVQIGAQCQKPSRTSLSMKSAADLANLGSIAKLPWIKALSISNEDDFDGKIDLSGLASLPELQFLKLDGLGNFDAADIQGDALRSVSISNSRPSNYDFLASLDGLETLQLQRALGAITDLPLAEMGGLKQLSIIDSELTSLKGIEVLEDLDGIALSNTAVQDLGPLAALNLKRVTLLSDRITDLSPLSSSTQITHLRIGGPSITSLDGLSLGPALEHFSGTNSGVSDISALGTATHVQRVVLEGANVADIEALSGKAYLEKLDLRLNPISDLSPLVGMRSLRVLQLTGTMVFDLSPLETLTSVEELSLSRTPALDIRPLLGMVGLKGLWLNETMVDDLSPLLELPALEGFVVDDHQLQTKQSLPAYIETRIRPSDR